MTTDRVFCRLNKSGSIYADTPAFGMTEIPEGGLCLSSFLVINSKENPKAVLMGHLNPKAPWDHIGALDQKRVERHSKKWMLPSSHLILRESPQEAARRILREQLEMDEDDYQKLLFDFSQPQRIFSDVYQSPNYSNPNLLHWDIGFIFKGEASPKDILSNQKKAWTDLKFVELSKTRREEIARSHEDVLAYAGYTLA
jgi:ADP-ribose pyrophosphatase YjhB (NUDIX family)